MTQQSLTLETKCTEADVLLEDAEQSSVSNKTDREPVGAYVTVAVPLPVRRTFSYAVPVSMVTKIARGMRVAVRFAARKLAGVVIEVSDVPPPSVSKCLPVAGILDATPVFSEELLSFLEQAAEYYLHPLGEVIRAAAPPLHKESMKALRNDGFLDDAEWLKGRAVSLKKVLFATACEGPLPKHLGSKQRAILDHVREVGACDHRALTAHGTGPKQVLRSLSRKGLVLLEEREASSDPFFATDVVRDVPREPTDAQRHAIETLLQHVRSGNARQFLLHGVTGSGKTEVYLQVIAEAIALGKGAIVLVPEISLTPQLVERFRARFGDEIAVLHSGLSIRSRDLAHRKLRAGTLCIAVGARSALFAPVSDLGVVIVDEEHDSSFKQEEGFRYHARDMAMLRAHRASAVCILGSATPALETYRLSQLGKVHYLSLPERANRKALPKVEIVDLRRHRNGPAGMALLSAPLQRALQSCLAEGGQAILFLNRRGYVPVFKCTACGDNLQCPACAVALTEHRQEGVLRCHYCDFRTSMPKVCPSCQAQALMPLGLGTEQLQHALHEVFPEARVGRLDRDTVVGGRGAAAVLDDLRSGAIDILVGTQMVTKGHDLPNVRVVGVILADHSLAFPDFRASERTFQLLAQVAGRAGRGDRAGSVIFQTFQPDHPAIELAARHDYARFAPLELESRKDPAYPPFTRLIAVRLDAGDENFAKSAIDSLVGFARSHDWVRSGQVDVLGPATAPIPRLRGRFRFRFLLRSHERILLREVARCVQERIAAGIAPARATIDVDPVSML
ncbi:MAG: primosomal protein N' [Myxococcota bacterium]